MENNNELADFRDWMIDNMRFVECLRIGSERHPLGGAIQVTDYYIAEINKRLSAIAPVADAEVETLRADMLAVAEQVGIVYVADHHAPVAGPTPAILRAIAKMQRDAGDADQLRSAGLSLRAENARLQADLAAARAERDAALLDVQLGTSESEVVRLALAQRDAARVAVPPLPIDEGDAVLRDRRRGLIDMSGVVDPNRAIPQLRIALLTVIEHLLAGKEPKP